jgi:oxepin-CoA hydrolase/3-oxo-5,6-dehydrosuberyl-CoA semialdehyde dehydrogenase
LFGGIVAHGYLVVSLAAGLFVEPNPGPVLANFGVDNLRFLTPVKAGDTIESDYREVTLADIDHFAEFTGDTFYAHTDPVAAAANPFFDGIVAHGYLILSLAAGLFVDPDPGPVLANYGIDDLRFLTPVYPGDELTVTLTCKAITPRGDSAHGEVRWDAEVTKQDGSVCAQYDVLTMVAK